MYNVVGMCKSNTHFPTGFTLIELIIAVGLMAILSAGVISLIGPGSRQYARDTDRRSDINTIAGALEMYRNDCSGYPGSTAALTPTYMTTIPTDPRNGSAYTYTRATAVSVVCGGVNVTVYRTFTLCANGMEKPPATPYCVYNP
jgi:prepilin-type N-terminal cleavage/methylation domain-containing protein